jgi:hypothetical protein
MQIDYHQSIAAFLNYCFYELILMLITTMPTQCNLIRASYGIPPIGIVYIDLIFHISIIVVYANIL